MRELVDRCEILLDPRHQMNLMANIWLPLAGRQRSSNANWLITIRACDLKFLLSLLLFFSSRRDSHMLAIGFNRWCGRTVCL